MHAEAELLIMQLFYTVESGALRVAAATECLYLWEVARGTESASHAAPAVRAVTPAYSGRATVTCQQRPARALL